MKNPRPIRLQIYYTLYETAFGRILIAGSKSGVCLLEFIEKWLRPEQRLAKEFPQAAVTKMPPTSNPLSKQWTETLNDYLEGKSQLIKLPLDIGGTAFQMLVWRFLQTIPCGESRSYSEVAKAIGKPAAIRAVASACAGNRVALVIPCHRVIRGDGNLAGYRWGLKRKRALLKLEKC